MFTSIPSSAWWPFRLQGQTVIDLVTSRPGRRLPPYRHGPDLRQRGRSGPAIATSGVPRDDIFVTTKVWTDSLTADKLVPSLHGSLARLGMGRVDLALVHWPSPADAVPVAETLTALADAQELGLADRIGVSNFTVARLQQAINAVGADRIATLQIEIHPFLPNRTVVDFARSHGIHITAYMPLAYGKVMTEPVLQAIAAAHGDGCTGRTGVGKVAGIR